MNAKYKYKLYEEFMRKIKYINVNRIATNYTFEFSYIK